VFNRVEQAFILLCIESVCGTISLVTSRPARGAAPARPRAAASGAGQRPGRRAGGRHLDAGKRPVARRPAVPRARAAPGRRRMDSGPQLGKQPDHPADPL